MTGEFLTLALTEARMRGMSDLPLARVAHPVGTIALDALKRIAESAVDLIAAEVTAPKRQVNRDIDSVNDYHGGDAAPVCELPADAERMFAEFVRRGWSDGLPIVAPTRVAVDRMIGGADLSGDCALGTMPPLSGLATVEKIAVNAVMAGCLPEYFPLVVAAVKCLLQPGFNLDGVQTTTGNVAPVVLVNGPCRDALQINYGSNALGQGWRANATIGRALRLILTNVGGAAPGLYDKSTLGQPAKHTFCFGENEALNPWEPLHVERRLAREDNAVSVFGCSGINSAVDMASQSARGLLKTFALTMMGGLASGVTTTEVMFVICPEHAAIFAKDGFSKAKIREALFEAARIDHDLISEENLELLSKRRPMWFKNGLRHVGAVDRPEDIWIVVAGGAGAKSAYLPGRTGTKLQTTAVR